MGMVADYGDEHIRTLDWKEHIRRRPGMYIGKLGDGTSADDGIYILIKEVLDNSVDEYMMGFGKSIDITIADDKTVTVRDYGRGVPLGKLVDVASKMNTGAKYDSKAFKKSVGLNGVGIKAVNALSDAFLIRSVRDGEARSVRFEKGNEIADVSESGVGEKNGTMVSFHADESVFGSYDFHMEYVESMVRNYTYLNAGLTIRVNGQAFVSKNGLLDLLQENLGEEPLYPPVHLSGEDIEVVITHGHGYGETYYSFVNGQHTTQGGTHQTAFREGIAKTIKEFYKKDYDAADVRTSVIAAISVKVEEPMFESQTKTKLGSKEMGPNGPTVRNFIVDFLKTELDNFLHKHPETADILQKKIQENEKERKAISGIQKKAREMAKKVSLNNKKLRDCRIHLTDKNDRAEESMIFITEGNSASGSITKSRDVNTQAVFSLRGKPLNCFGLTKKIVYENEEFNLLQAALNIEEDMDNLRYNKIVVATDADVDGMHIRLLLMTFFLQFFPEVIRSGHLYILQTPLFRVRNRRETRYCYSEEERQRAVDQLGPNPEITRFKGLGEISADEFKEFIGENMRLDKVRLTKEDPVADLLEFYMGKNSMERQGFIIGNLRIEADYVDNLI
ncbi:MULTISPECIES: DNA topoisomerase IV subunit B [Alistipes]|uniref:DNA topoisomerase (ATP-hydrolyzing) n=1 Tax=Alistipes hominis TaxID=2763015 RepID=A0ABR7CK35_9BACT|nr:MULTISPECIES: DNA topoisomerase IV subunit B [Alistipes]MBC5616018.1 type IIA DNA topoisomerase subunit B [Alistipes hominis]MBS1413454.1 type IIA DNA topoisomerase subunit B [Alistipes sp.]RHR61483.1 type IIA DNA topoisomerase subunit B [Alistipes sp. AF17-16]